MRKAKQKRTFMVSVGGPNPVPPSITLTNKTDIPIKVMPPEGSLFYNVTDNRLSYFKPNYTSLSDAEALLKLAKKQGAHKDANVKEIDGKLVVSWEASE